jgi:hypothetical protein
MASNARKTFDNNLGDINDLIEYYEQAEASFHGSSPGADVVLRSAMVLLVTYWEAYIEDIASEVVTHLTTHVSDPGELPKELKKIIAKELKEDKNELAVWNLAADGWKTLIQKRLPSLREARDRTFNTPKSRQTRDFLRASTGIQDITTSWTVESEAPESCCKTLDLLVKLRGRIAHRGKLKKHISVEFVQMHKKWFENLVTKTEEHINNEIETVTGTPLT